MMDLKCTNKIIIREFCLTKIFKNSIEYLQHIRYKYQDIQKFVRIITLLQ